MRTNRQALKEAIESGAVQAWIEGRDIEVKDVDGTEFEKFERVDIDVPNFPSEHHQWRVPTIKKLRPWKAEEVPLGAWIRWKGGGGGKRSLILSYERNNVITILANIAFDIALQDYEVSRDNGQTWLPCGVEE